jgi:hypothetical protein
MGVAVSLVLGLTLAAGASSAAGQNRITPRAPRLSLVTNNTAEFGRVKGLTLENWTLPVRRSRSKADE